MKRGLFIAGIVLIVLLTGVWMYLLFFGAPEKGAVFNMFGFGDTTDPNIEEGAATPEQFQPFVDTNNSPEALRQLTTKPVIGFREITSTTSSSTFVYYVEAGTGHIFSLNYDTGEEERISNITVPMARQALISTDGKYVAITSKEGNNASVQIISLKAAEPTVQTLDENVENVAVSNEGDLFYTTQSNITALARAYNFVAGTSRTLFEIPFREVTVSWGDAVAGPHYFYPKAAGRLEGALYSARSGVINRLPISGYGLTAITKGDYTVFNTQADNVYSTYLYDATTGVKTKLDETFLVEKCVFVIQESSAACFNTNGSTYDLSLPDAWYQFHTTMICGR
jgi:hypothetical protein